MNLLRETEIERASRVGSVTHLLIRYLSLCDCLGMRYSARMVSLTVFSRQADIPKSSLGLRHTHTTHTFPLLCPREFFNPGFLFYICKVREGETQLKILQSVHAAEIGKLTKPVCVCVSAAFVSLNLLGCQGENVTVFTSLSASL